jgi:iron complex transport system substrate-binding protein
MSMSKLSKFLVAAVTVFLLASLLCQAAPAADTRTIVDQTGRKVMVPANPSRVVCLGPGCLRLIVYLQAQDMVVGIEDMEKRFPDGRPYYLAYPELGKLPTISPGGPTGINKKPDLEGVLSVQPQVVFITYMQGPLADQVQSLLGVPVVVLSYGPFASFAPKVVYESLRLAGDILGKKARAEELVAFFDKAQADLTKRSTASGKRPKAYVGGIGFKGTQGIESSDAEYVPFRWLSTDNMAGGPGKKGHVFLDKENLLKMDPPVIFIDGGGLSLIEADYAKRPDYYGSMSAFRNGQVYVLHPFNWYTTNLGTMLADSYTMGKVLHPESFADVDPTVKVDQIYKFLMGKPVHAAMVKQYGQLGDKPGFLSGK